jgi:hypothetical protein
VGTIAFRHYYIEALACRMSHFMFHFEFSTNSLLGVVRLEDEDDAAGEDVDDGEE